MLKIGVESPRIPEGFCRSGRCPEYATRWEQFRLWMKAPRSLGRSSGTRLREHALSRRVHL